MQRHVAHVESIERLLAELWSDYASLNPQAAEIHQLLLGQGETHIFNDHIAYRTFSHASINMHEVARPFIELGYIEAGARYEFKTKNLQALYLMPPKDHLPKIFISELLLERFKQTNLEHLLEPLFSAMAGKKTDGAFLKMGRSWNVQYSVYAELRKLSEYAAWVYAFGFRPNHFTVLLNSLIKFGDITRLNGLLKDHGFILNKEGGEIKGSPSKYLEQSSTMAAPVSVSFEEGVQAIPGCYYEFARRYPDATGQLFHGFVSESADKIFESTSHYDAKTSNPT